jgi:4-amino-4-deoxy-L-arabinose transferase-like glycosyltransferase
VLEVIRAIIGVPILIALLYVPGATLLNSLMARSRYRPAFSDTAEWLFTAVLVSVLVTGGLGFVLAEVGLFSAWLLLALVLLFALGLALILGQFPFGLGLVRSALALPGAYAQRETERRNARIERGALVVIIVVAVALFARPAEMVRGALDSGVYVNMGAALARTGAVLQRDVLMRQLNDDLGEGRELMQPQNLSRYSLDRLRMPGFFVFDKKAALVLPQFYWLFPVWIGLLYSLFGIWGALYATPLLALLCVLAVYFFARRVLTPGAALVALGLLVLCPVTIWFARYPIAEVLMGLLAFGGFFAFLRMVHLLRTADDEPITPQSAIRNPHSPEARRAWASFWGLVAGVSLGQLALARPDFIFYIAPVPAYLLYWRLTRRWQRSHTWFAASLGVMLAFYALHFFFFGFAYTIDLYYNKIQDLRRLWGPLLLVLYIGVGLLIAADRLYPRLRPLWVRAGRWFAHRRAIWVGLVVFALGAYALYLYAVAPWQANLRVDKAGQPIAQDIATTWESYIGAPVDEGGRYNLLRIGWYLSPFGLLLGVAGLLRWVWSRLNASTGLFFGALLLVSFVFIQETYTDAHYIYTMRRYISLILPALIIGFAWACQFIWSRLRPRPLGLAVGGVAALALALFFVYTARTVVANVEEEGAVGQLTALADRFKGTKSVVLFSNERDEPFLVATPLQYIFGIDSFVVNRSYPQVRSDILEGIVTKWQGQGYKVWVMLGANGGKLHFPHLALKEEGSWAYQVRELEPLYNQKPSNFSPVTLPWGIYSVQPAAPPPTLPYRIDIGEMDYEWLVAGFYAQEKASTETRYWRWTGEHAILRVPWPTSADGKTLSAGTVKLLLRQQTPVEGEPPRRAGPVAVKVSLNDTPVADVNVPFATGFVEHIVTVPEGVPVTGSDPGYALLHMEVPKLPPATVGKSNDPRVLGIQVDAVEVLP